MASILKSPIEDALSKAPSFGLPESFQRSEGRQTPTFTPGNVPYQAEFNAASQRYGVPVNVLMALAEQESSFNPTALGQPTKYGRAKGIMQYIDSTASSMGINPYDPLQAIDAAAKQLKTRLDQGYSMQEAVSAHFGGDDRKQWGPKTRAYGEEVLGKAQRYFDGTAAPVKSQQAQQDTRDWAKDYPAAQSAMENMQQNENRTRAIQLDSMLSELNKDEPGRYRPLTATEMAQVEQAQQQDKKPDNITDQQAQQPKQEERKQETPAVDFDKANVQQAQAQNAADTALQIGAQATQQNGKPQAELRAWEPTLWDRIKGLIPGDRDAAAVELAARRIAERDGVSVDEVYRSVGGQRPLFNPEGRAPIQALAEGAQVVGKQIPNVPKATANAVLRAVRGGDVPAEDKTMVDRGITATDIPEDKNADPNYSGLQGIDQSLGFTVSNLVPSLAAGAAGNVVSPGAGTAAGFATSGAIAYRASKDQFLSDVRKMATEKKGSPLTDREWNDIRIASEAAATRYGAWEAIPEALGSVLSLRLISHPLAGGTRAARMADALSRMGKEQAMEQATETATTWGQNREQRAVGLTNEDLSLGDAFRQQALQTALVSGISSGAMQGGRAAYDAVRGRQAAANPQAEQMAADAQATEQQAAATEEQAVAAAPTPSRDDTGLSDDAGPLERAVRGTAPQPDETNGNFWGGEPGTTINMQAKGDPETAMVATVERYERDGSMTVRGEDGAPYTVTPDDVDVVAAANTPQSTSQEMQDAGTDQEVKDERAAAVPEEKPEDAEKRREAIAKELEKQGVDPTTGEILDEQKPARQIKTEEAPAERKLTDMSEGELRDRMRYLASQAKQNGGWDTRLTTARRDVEKALDEKVRQAKADEQPARAETPAQPVADNATGVQPDEGGNTSQPARMALDTDKSGTSSGAVVSGEGTATDASSALTGADNKPKWFSTAEKAQAHLDKKSLTGYKVVEVKPRRFELHRDGTPTNEGTKPTTPVNPRINRAKKLVGDVGDIVSPSGDVGYVKGSDQYKIDRIDKNGTIHVTNQGTGGSTTITVAEMEAARSRRVEWSKSAPAVAETATEQQNRQQNIPENIPDRGEWRSFTPAEGTLGIPRDQMPQIKSEHRGAMVNFMNARGVRHEEQTVPANSLKPTQAEFSPSRVAQAAERTDGDRSILVSSDGYILDGHHQWLAARNAGQDVKTIRLDAPIEQLVTLAREFPSSVQDTSSAAGVSQNADDVKQTAENVKENTENATSNEGEKTEVENSEARPADYGANNKLVSADRAAELRQRLKAKFSQLNSGIDPEILAIGTELAVFHIEASARKFADFAKAMAADLDMPLARLRPYLRSWYNGARDMMEDSGVSIDGMDTAETVRSELAKLDQAPQPKKPPTGARTTGALDDMVNTFDSEVSNVSSPRTGLEPDSQAAGNPVSVSATPVVDESGRNGRGTAAAGDRAGEERGIGQRDQRLSDDGATAGGESGNQRVYREDGQFRSPEGAARSDIGTRSAGRSETGLSTERTRATAVAADAHAAGASDFDQRLAAQKAAPKETKWGDADSVRASLPMLLPAQQDDVVKVERQHQKENGILITNGTGTGKTASGLGVAKRFHNAGKDNILVVVPSDKIASDWVKFAGFMDMPLKQLEGITDNGTSGPVITTYANLGQNDTLAQRQWDLVIPDESHRLMQNEAGDVTDQLRMFRALTGHPDGFNTWLQAKHSDQYAKLIEAQQARDKDAAAGNETAAAGKRAERYQELLSKWNALYKDEQVKWRDRWSKQENLPKTVFMSATPFAYVPNTDYAEGYLFHHIPPADRFKDRSSGGYNVPDPRSAFYVEHFGYRMRYNKLTRPDAEVNTELMEQTFNQWLKDKGALTGRSLDVPFDYDRKFILIDDAAGKKLDQALEFLNNGDNGQYRDIYRAVMDTFDHQRKMFLLESMKARAAIPVIKEHLALGRKVLVIHDYNQGGGFNPFSEALVDMDPGLKPLARELFQRPLFRINFSGLDSALNTLTSAFPEALTFNGTVPKAKRRAAADKFNDDAAGPMVLIAQSDAMREGVSVHDTTGKHQRVSINLGLPVQPTKAIQLEGRTYRTGQASDAIFRYMTTGTAWEASAFATKLAERASTAENLAMGPDSRALKQSFIDAYTNAETIKASPEDGKGGKAADQREGNTISEFDKAKSWYYAQQKNTKNRESREGADYYATPEPVGLKMVEWAGIRPGDKVLEPSAGHGAIARFFPAQADVTMVEPSLNLSQRAALANGGARIVNQRFEDFNRTNKYDAIVMNPPYGMGGKTAYEHLEKAGQHIRENGRIVALMPRGGLADQRFNVFMKTADENGLHLIADIAMPRSTFERAGTQVNTRVLVLEKNTAKGFEAPQTQRIDLSGAESVNELFDRIEHLDVNPRAPRPTASGEPQYNDLSSGVTARELADQLQAQYPGLKLGLTAAGSVATLHRIELPATSREQGVGTKVMQQIVNWADATGKTLTLSPSGDFGGSKARLNGFYKRFGFVDNKGIRRDYEISESMYREPQGLQLNDLPEGDTRFAADAMAELAAHDEMFQYPRATGERTLQGVFDKVMPDVRIKWEAPQVDDNANETGVTHIRGETGRGRYINIYETPDEVWFDVSRLDEGQGGSGIYQAVADYALNTGRRFVGDPDGLSDIALRRRTEAMLSSALKHGTTDHLEPHERQLSGDKDLGVPPLRWKEGDFAFNIRSLIDTSLANIKAAVPEIDRARYDFDTGTYRTSTGQPLLDTALERWSEHSKLRQARAGIATLKRSILLNTLARTESSAQPGLLERLFRVSGQLLDRPLQNTFYDWDSRYWRLPEGNRIQLASRLRKLQQQQALGQLTPEQYSEHIGELADWLEDRRMESNAKRAFAERQRGADMVLERLHRARRRGEISDHAADIAIWALNRNPQLAEDLGISIREKGGNSYNRVERIARLVGGNMRDTTPIHEILHHTERMMPPGIQKGIVTEYNKAWKRAYDKANPELRQALDNMRLANFGDKKAQEATARAFETGQLQYHEHYQLTNASEFWAVNAAEIMASRHAASSKAWVSRARQWLREFASKLKSVFGLPSDTAVLRGLNAVLKGDGSFQSRDMLAIHPYADTPVRDLQRGDYADQPRSPSGMEPSPNIPTEAEDRSRLSKWFDRMRNLPRDKMTDAMDSGLAVVPMRPLVLELGRNLPAAKEYMRLKQSMDAMRNEWHARTDKVAQRWLKYRKDNKLENEQLMELMHDATLAQVDPSERFAARMTDRERDALRTVAAGSERELELVAKAAEDDRRRDQWQKLNDRFKALSPEAQELFSAVRDEYTAIANEYEKVLMANMEKAIDVRIKKAEREHRYELQRITDEGMTGQAKDDAVAAADRKLKIAKTKTAWNRKARITQLRQQFEMDRLQGPYFPLARFGNLFVTVRDAATGKVESFSRFEKAAEQREFAELMSKDPKYKVQIGTLDDTNAARKAVDANFVADVEDILADLPNAEQVKDEVWQRYLESLPDFSIRKNRIHRTGRKGFIADALRAYGNQMFHSSHQLARLKHTFDMEEALDAAREEAQKSKDPVRDGKVINEMEKRHEFIMNPKGGPLVQVISQAAFIYFLAASPKAAIVNLSQTAIMGVPMLGAFDGTALGMTRAANQLMRAMGDFTRGRGHAANSKRLTDDERKAMEQAYETGLIDRTQSHDLAGIGETGVEYSPARTRVMALMSWGFHQGERLNREVTFLAAYRMAKAKGFTQAQAVQAANDLTWKTHFDYQNTSRPRVMHSDTMKALLVFRNFTINMLWRLFRDIHQATKGESPEIRKEARIQLAGTTGMMMLNAGLTGTWFFGIAMVLAGMFMDKDKDPEAELKKNMIEALGPQMAGIVLDGVPGYLSGTSLSDSIGMKDLWFRDPSTSLEGKGAMEYWKSQLLGAPPSIVDNWIKGYQMIQEGQTYRGIETIMPKFIKDPMKAYRYATEGATNKRGDVIVDDIDTGDIIRQALGFTPAKLAEQYDLNNAGYNMQQNIMDQRKKLMDAYWKADQADDTAKLDKLEEDIDAYNEKYPEMQITPKSLNQSAKTREKNAENATGGMRYNPKLRDRILEEQSPTIYR